MKELITEIKASTPDELKEIIFIAVEALEMHEPRIKEYSKDSDEGKPEGYCITVANADFTEYRTYHENGNPNTVQYFVDGKEHGYFRAYDDECNLEYTSEFNMGRMATDTSWFKNGKRESYLLYNEDGELIQETLWDEEGNLLSNESYDD